MFHHVPVLCEAIVNAFNLTAGDRFVDGTVGGGGHLAAIGQNTSGLCLIGVDQDPAALDAAQTHIQKVLPDSETHWFQSNFAHLKAVLAEHQLLPITGGILLDIGVSSHQLDCAERGFSFSKQGPLDMRMNPHHAITAASILNTWPERELSDLFFQYGEERWSRPIARAIVQDRDHTPFTQTTQLAGLIERIYQSHRRGKPEAIHPATRVFQALRIAVNQELDVLSTLLSQLPELLAPKARVAVITFHSLEDRIVKQYFKAQACTCICPPDFPICQCQQKPTLKILTAKPIVASSAEIEANPRSRSAKLRVAERLP